MYRTSTSHGSYGCAPWIVVTGLDGSGKTTLVGDLTRSLGAHRFRLPYHDFVKPALQRAGAGRPFGDIKTDRLLFALDARLTNDLIRQWRTREPYLVSQRGWMDNYIFGDVQGLSYQATSDLLGTAELERPLCCVYLIADPVVAYDRIKHDPEGDKYETLAFMKRQYQATLRFYDAVQSPSSVLTPLAGSPTYLIDTTRKTPAAVFEEAEAFVQGVLFDQVEPRHFIAA